MTYLPTLNWKDETYYKQHPHQAKLRDACLSRVSWDALCRYASSRNSDRQCTLLEQNTLGGGHLIRLLRSSSPETSESNQTLWIARIQLEQSTPETESLLCAEINTMELVRIKTGIPVPRIHGYELNDGNSVRAAFTLMDFLPGSSAMDADGGFKVHGGRVPDERKTVFFEEVARVQVNLSSIRLPKIGSVIRRPDNSFDVGPLPHLGGPFSTANEFFEAWARHAKFPSSEESIRDIMRHSPSSIREEVLYSIQNFPRRLQELASGGRVSTKNNTGPFPLYHPDLYHSNIIVDESYKVLGVIDWEGACTVPWEVVQPPLFLTTVPPAMDDPGNYGEDGRPKDLNTKCQYADVADYVRCVQEIEEDMGADQTLSGILLNLDVQGLAFALKVYLDPGKMGLYCNVLEAFG